MIKGHLKPVSLLSTSELVDLVYKELLAEMEFKARTGNRLDAGKKELRERAEKLAADQEHLLEGRKGAVLLGPKPNQRKLRSMPRLFQVVKRLLKLDIDKFLDFCSITLETIDSFHLPEDELRELISEARTGTRSIKPIPLGEKN